MKNQTILKKFSWLLAICFVAALALSACNKSAEHPKKDQPATNQPPAK
jgi:preprotein translocase subunit SecG